MRSFGQDLSASAADFKRLVWPVMSSSFGGGEITPIETQVDSDLAKRMDISSGIDAWQFSLNGQMRGIGSRVQWGIDYRTFSVRYSRDSGAETEYHKRLKAIESPEDGWMYPHYTVQAYCSLPRGGGQLLSAAVVRTRELILVCRGIVETPLKGAGYVTRCHNASFIVVKWDWLQKFGFSVQVFEDTQSMAESWVK